MLHFFHLRGLKCYLLTYCIINLGQCEMKERIIITMPVTELEINFTGDVVQKVILKTVIVLKPPLTTATFLYLEVILDTLTPDTLNHGKCLKLLTCIRWCQLGILVI